MTDIYASREAPLPGVGAELIVEAAGRSGHRHVSLCPDWQRVPELLTGRVRAGDVVLTMGAGDIYRLAELLVAEEAA